MTARKRKRKIDQARWAMRKYFDALWWRVTGEFGPAEYADGTLIKGAQE